jgi:uncharacterized membrane-anchored protein
MDHPLRFVLNNEILGRPFVPVRPPTRVRHVALVHRDGGEVSRVHLEKICHGLGVIAPGPDARHHLAQIVAGTQLKWERHGEFTTWTLVEAVAGTESVGTDSAHDGWLTALPGDRLVSLDMTVVADEGAETEALAARLFTTGELAGADVSGGKATVWTDFRIQADGGTRILLALRGLGDLRSGRLIRRILEIETYRMMALLALPVARDAAPELDRLDMALTRAIATMGGVDAEASGRVVHDQDLLTQLTALAADVEALASRTSFRFAAARAYDRLVAKRLVELGETRRADLQQLSSFLDRRFKPAMQTCEAVGERVETLARRVGRASNLLRTRVDIALEAQNQKLLMSMDDRARQQLRLQQTVEGLSVFAISYYLHGLLAKVVVPIANPLLAWPEKTIEAALAPIVLIAVWMVVRRVRKQLKGPGYRPSKPE